MLEQFMVFSLSGLVLWEMKSALLRGDPIGSLISNVLLQERGGNGGHYDTEYHQLQYSISTKCSLIFLAVYNKGLSLQWVEKFTNGIHKCFVDTVDADIIANYTGTKINFDTEFKDLLTLSIGDGGRRQAAVDSSGNGKGKGGMRTFSQTAKGKELAEESGSSGSGKKKKKKRKKNKKKKNNSEDEEEEEEEDQQDFTERPGDSKDDDESKTLFRGMSVRKVRTGPSGFKAKNKKNATTATKTNKKQNGAHWKDPTSKKLNKKDSQALMNSLDAGNRNVASADEHKAQLDDFKMKYLGEEDDGWGKESKSINGSDGGWFSSLSAVKAMKSMANRVTGSAVITEEELVDVKAAMIGQLVSKNVARDVADVIMDSVSESVVGKSLSTFEKVSTVVNTALEESVGRILTPKKDLDLVRNVMEAKKKKKPYVIVFVGINGVGKSTSLAKVCYHLLQKSFRPLIAACDTFRSGAVEQLKVHADCLGVDVFEQGYASDSSKVAQSAIIHATREGHDIVLVDTAGRMQNNKPHMVALSAVITLNSPDLILFVGEALAGNDAIDQMTQFNQALRDHAKSNRLRLIDGIVLTKFDCVDDKVGTAVSMVHKTATPIMFVGTGQKYTHLRKLNVADVLHKLFNE